MINFPISTGWPWLQLLYLDHDKKLFCNYDLISVVNYDKCDVYSYITIANVQMKVKSKKKTWLQFCPFRRTPPDKISIFIWKVGYSYRKKEREKEMHKTWEGNPYPATSLAHFLKAFTLNRANKSLFHFKKNK